VFGTFADDGVRRVTRHFGRSQQKGDTRDGTNLSPCIGIEATDGRTRSRRGGVPAGRRRQKPSALAPEAAAIAVGGRWVFTIDEPLLAPRAPGESGGDVLGRLARVLRGLQAVDGRAPLVVCDRLDILGAGVFALDEKGLMRCADDLDQLRLLP
jgi:hypothetical protein